METLHAALASFIDAEWFRTAIGMVVLLNPFAIFPQVVKVFRAPSVDGISLFAFGIFALIQIAFGLEAIRAQNGWVFLAMVLSLVESLTIITVVHVRKRKPLV